MINFHLEISNPFSKNRFKDLGSLHGKISKNKFWELQHTFYDGTILESTFKFSTKGDHAGLEIVLGVITYGIHFRIYDTRHWDYETNRWYIYDDKGAD